MGRTGPTPKPGGDTRRRRPSPTGTAAAMGPAVGNWLPSTKEAWNSYTASEAAHILRVEDAPAVLRLFERIDKLTRLWDAVPDDPNDAEKALRSVRILDAMVARGCAELGIGPLARARLGIGSAPKQRSALEQFRDEEGEDA